MRLCMLPIEILEVIVNDLDSLSKIYVRSTCKDLNKAVNILSTVEDNFNVIDIEDKYDLNSINLFVDHIYDKLISGDSDFVKYYMLHSPGKIAMFIKQRVGKKYNYSVNIEENNLPKMRMFYDGRNKRYKCYKFMANEFTIPNMLYVIAFRFLMKIYNSKNIDYNFNINNIPELVMKMLSINYKGQLIKEVIFDSFTIL